MKIKTFFLMILAITVAVFCVLFFKQYEKTDVIKFVKENGEQITFKIGYQSNYMKLDGRIVNLEDCSDPKYFCLESKEVLVILPRNCDFRESGREYEFSRGSDQFIRVKIDPHGQKNDGMYVASERSGFMFYYKKDAGILEVYHDKKGIVEFGINKNGNDLNYRDLRNYRYVISGRSNLFRCQITKR